LYSYKRTFGDVVCENSALLNCKCDAAVDKMCDHGSWDRVPSKCRQGDVRSVHLSELRGWRPAVTRYHAAWGAWPAPGEAPALDLCRQIRC
jgi:hypothetical protein